MRYIMLIWQNPDAFEALPDEEKTQIFGEVDEIMAELDASGEWIGGEGLSREATAVRVRDGVTSATDGPYLEGKELLAGYCLIDVASHERAVEITARWPDARYAGMELRALMS
jgi:hypothetical protein